MDTHKLNRRHLEMSKENSIIDIIEGHVEELIKEVEYFDKQKQSHGHQDIWIKFLTDILAEKNPKREKW